MSRIGTLSVMVLVAFGLVLTGCEEKTDDQEETQEQQVEESEAEEPEEADEEEEESADYTQEDYVQASVELSCIDAELGDEDLDDREAVEENVLGKYGLDQESYAAADSDFGDDEDVSDEIEEALEDCDEDQAREFAGLEADGDEEDGEDEEAAPAPTPAYVGTVSATKENASGFDRAELSVTVRDDFSANGKFSGKREKGFRVSLKGEVSKDGRLKLSGKDGKNSVEVEGDLKSDGANVEVSGSIWEKKFSTPMQLK